MAVKETAQGKLDKVQAGEMAQGRKRSAVQEQSCGGAIEIGKKDVFRSPPLRASKKTVGRCLFKLALCAALLS